MAPWVIWSAVAVLFVIIEIFTAGFFIIGFGLGAIPAAVVAWFAPQNYAAQMIVFVAGSALFLVGARRFAARVNASGSAEKVGPDRMIGKCGLVIETIDPSQSLGMVRVEHEEWRAQSADNMPIEKGVPVRVDSVSGTRFIVSRVATESES
jgi:membrane protein implicated in regulation of membrane protease activity